MTAKKEIKEQELVEIPRQAVDSTNAKTVGYDFKGAYLQVEYHSGAIWNYYPFTPTEWQAALKSPSIGKHIANRIVPHKKGIPVRQGGTVNTPLRSQKKGAEKNGGGTYPHNPLHSASRHIQEAMRESRKLGRR